MRSVRYGYPQARAVIRRMTIPEAAASLGLAPATLRRQVKLGALRATKVGRDWHVTPKEV